MWTDILLTEDMRALEVTKCLSVSPLLHQQLRQGEFFLETLPVRCIHAGLRSSATEDR
jgi:hypothetical protein